MRERLTGKRDADAQRKINPVGDPRSAYGVTFGAFGKTVQSLLIEILVEMKEDKANG